MNTPFLIVAATPAEVAPVTGKTIPNADSVLHCVNHRCHVLITGIGIANTIFELTKVLLYQSYDVVINAGICGAYRDDLRLGEVVNVVEDRFWDQKVETGSGILDWSEANLAPLKIFQSTWSDHPAIQRLIPVRAITSDTVHANKITLEQISLRCNPEIESMEGAAVAFVCEKMGVAYCQMRSVSNRVGIRDKSLWKIPEAVENLNAVLCEIIA